MASACKRARRSTTKGGRHDQAAATPNEVRAQGDLRIAPCHRRDRSGRRREFCLENRFLATELSAPWRDRKSTRLNSSHGYISYAVFCLKKKKETQKRLIQF